MAASDPRPAATVQRTAQEPPLLPPAVRQALERPGPFALGLDAWLAAECGATRPEGLAAAVRARQLELLNADLCHMATHSPLYRQRLTGAGRWSAAGLRPLRDLAELAELPFTTADDLRPGEALLCVSRDEVARMVTVSTSGSTGAPKRLAFSDAELARTRDFFAVGMAQMVTAGQLVAVLLPGAHRPRGITDLLAGSLAPQGVRVTAEVCPHHFTLTSDDIHKIEPSIDQEKKLAINADADTNFKMNPPLRSREDVQALKEGLRDNIMDVISTDHAPHTFEEKNTSMKKAPFGIVGLETAACLTYTELVLQGYLTPMQMAEKMSYNPAKIVGIDKGDIQPGKIADIVIFDPEKTYKIDKTKFASKGRNTPFDGREVTGKVMATIVDGRVVYEAEA